MLAYVWRCMLEHTRDQLDHFRRVHRQEGRGRPAEVMNAHVLSELGDDPRASEECSIRRGKRSSSTALARAFAESS
jgi:hypothetical protein